MISSQQSCIEDLPPEAEGLSPSEIAEAERIYQNNLLQHHATVAQDKTGILNRVFRAGAFRQVKEAKESKDKLDAKFAKLIQLPLFPYPEATRVVSNDMARSALFSAVQGADRKMLKDELLATVDGIKIIFTGEQLNQDDHDLLMQLVHIARNKPFGEYITVPANAILVGLGLDKGKSQHEQLKARIKRLVAASVEVNNTKTKTVYYGHIIEEAIQDETSKYWVYRLNPKMRPLYDYNTYSLVEWEQRRELKRKDLARWLQNFYSTHSDPFPLSVEYLHNMSGSMASLKEFRRALKNALDALVSIGFLLAWEIEAKRDIVAVCRAPIQKAITN